MKVLVRLFLFSIFFLLGGFGNIHANSLQKSTSFMFVEDSGKSENVCPDVVSNDTTPAFKDFQSLEKGELFCLNEEDNESDDISPDYSKKKTEIINYFNVFCPQLSAYSYNNITKQLSFSEQFFLLSSYRQILLQVIMI